MAAVGERASSSHELAATADELAMGRSPLHPGSGKLVVHAAPSAPSSLGSSPPPPRSSPWQVAVASRNLLHDAREPLAVGYAPPLLLDTSLAGGFGSGRTR
nr:unnamed protein product [Digitaria exilis]